MNCITMTMPSLLELYDSTCQFLQNAYANSTKLLAVATSILLERAVDEGLGRHAGALVHSQLEAYTKLAYATGVVGIASQVAAKLSVAFLFERLAPRRDKKGITISCHPLDSGVSSLSSAPHSRVVLKSLGTRHARPVAGSTSL